MESTNYYNENADDFFTNTCDVDMSGLYEKFEALLPANAKLLDAGCGSGRDTKHFLSKGYQVNAMDASDEMVKRACAFTGIDVKKAYFEEIEEKDAYDGIWSCASLLHVPKQSIPTIFEKFIAALKPERIWYMSFKYGEDERTKDGRLFNDYTESSLNVLLDEHPQLKLIEMWLTDDRRPDRDDKWLNVIVRKVAK